MKKGDKKGTHVGFVLSFVIFIMFLVFIYTLLNPGLETLNKKFLLDGLRFSFIEDATVEDLTTFTIIIQTDKHCANVNNILNDPNFQGIDYTNLMIKDENNNGLVYTDSGQNLLIGTGGTSYEGLIKIYYGASSTYCSGSPLSCGVQGCGTPVDYELKQITTESEIVDSQIVSIAEEYETDYEGLKNSFNIPDANDFWFNFTYADGTSVWPEEKEIPSSVNVYVSNSPVLYVDANGKQSGNLLLKVW
ncbi:MAG: hypothetical protein ABIH49_00135 [archaeon]